MKNLLFACFTVFAVIGLSSCGGDSCTQADWIGTYSYQGTETSCDLGDGVSLELEQTIIVEAGEGDKVSIDGDEATINEDNCSITAFILTIELDGDDLIILPGTECEARYKRN